MRGLRHRTIRHASRSGLTILEVMMAIGVAIIGLFGVWALIPVAGQRAERALLEDDKSALGRSAFHEFDVRGMRDPNSWLISAQALNNGAPPNTLARFDPNNTTLRSLAVCLDPQLMSEYQSQNMLNTVQTFPAQPGNPPVIMARATLRRFPTIANNNSPMDVALARKVFQTADDIIVHRQSGGDPPLQDYGTSNQSRRLAHGDLSWMATLVPSNAFLSETHLLSVVVFDNRDVAATISDQEAVFNIPGNVTGFPGGGFGGGDVRLDSANTGLNRNDWVVLAQQSTLGVQGARFNWYRVVAVDPDTSAGVTFVTLEGQDWNANVATQCIAVRNVVAVYEKTIRLETSSLWKTN